MNYKDTIEQIYNTVKNDENKGKLANYIPELAKVDPNNFGVHISTINNNDLALEIIQINFLFKVFQKCFHFV